MKKRIPRKSFSGTYQEVDSQESDAESHADVDNEGTREDHVDSVSSSDSDEKVWSALSFMFIIIVLGVPLWWILTKVERSYFPYHEIEDLKQQTIRFPINVYIQSCQASGNHIKETLISQFKNSALYYARVETSVAHDFCKKNLLELELLSEIHSQKPGNIQLIEVESLKSGEITMGKYRTAYFSPTILPLKIYLFLQEVLLHEEVFQESISAVISPGSVSENIYYLRKVRPSPKYDVVFSIVNPQPEKIDFSFDIKKAINRYFLPIINKLSLSEFHIKSQWLYLVDLKQVPKKMDGYFGLSKQQIPHIITPLEKRIGSGVARNPCIHFVLYVSRCEHSPLFFTGDWSDRSKAVLSARWGGIQLLNANRTVCDIAGQQSVSGDSDAEPIMRTFVYQLRSLLGLKDLSSSSPLLPHHQLTIYPWEVDGLVRMRILELFVSSRMTLGSLSQLLGKISNIVITDEVGDAVVNAVNHAKYTLEALATHDLNAALNFSTHTYVYSEFAFTHPSLLALLYFPDDQKYAVYIPLYLPVMIPVLLSIKNIFAWIQKKMNKIK